MRTKNTTFTNGRRIVGRSIFGWSWVLIVLIWTARIQGQEQVVVTQKNCVQLESVCIRPGDEIWLVSARRSHLSPCDMSLLGCSRLGEFGWVDSDLDELVSQHQTDRSRATMIFAHGNRTNLSWAESRGLQFYGTVLGTAAETRPPVRFVIFAWKSDVEKLRPLSDFRIKSQRSIQLGNLFGRFLKKFEDRHLLVGGFSLGGQVVLSGISQMGSLVENENELNETVQGYQVALFTPVFDPRFRCSGIYEYLNTPWVDQTVIFVNRKDRAVRLAERVERRMNRGSSSILGQLSTEYCGGGADVLVHDITCEVGSKHSIAQYANSPTLKSELLEMLSRVYDGANSSGGDSE